MLKLVTIGILLFTGGLILGQSSPLNDDCSGLIDLGLAPACTNTVYSTLGATPSNIGFGNLPSCFANNTVTSDVWFAFTTSDTIFNYVITLKGIDQGGGTIINPQIAVYRGGCETNGLAELLCGTAESGSSDFELSATGLTPNVTYFIRVDHYVDAGQGQAGNFQLCVEEQVPTNTIDQGGSTACSGRLFDSGGAEGNYQDNEDYTFTICPDEPHQCINFTLEYYNIDVSDEDLLIFYEGNTSNFNNIIAQFGGFELEPGGGVCFEVQAASDCMTVRFISNGNVNKEGFAGSWNCSLQPCKLPAPISVEGNTSNEQIVDFISTPQTVVEITDISCPENAYGTFLAGDSTDLGLERGLLLTTGNINLAPGPNTIVDAGFEHMAPGDADLDYLSEIQGEGSLSGDACIVELDVFAATNELTFEYIFASEEYPEFVNTEFNDIFAFFISGPGINGDPNIDNQLNIAVLPDGSTPVQINSVSQIENWQYFRTNELGHSLEYDGLIADFLGSKKSLTARAQVDPCQTYHLKLAIADRRDFAYDSGVFISELRGGAPQFRMAYQSGIDFLIEDCTTVSDTLYVGLNSPLQDSISYEVRIGGTATLGEDYLLDIPKVITFPAGETSIGFPIEAISDEEDELPETIELSLTNNFGCGEVVYTTINIGLRDKLDVQIEATADTLIQCKDSTLTLAAVGAAEYFWTPAGNFENPENAGQSFLPSASGWVEVEGKVGNFCIDSDSVYINVLTVEVEIQALDPTAICLGDSVRLQVVNNVSDANLQWLPAPSNSDTSSALITVKPEESSAYVASVNAEGCLIMDTIQIDVDRFAFPDLRSDTTICQHSSLNLSVPFDTSGLDVFYQWTPAPGLDDPDTPTPIATPQVSTEYTLLATSTNGGCEATGSVRIEVLPADVSIQQPDTTFICLGTSLDLTATTNTNNFEKVIWTASDGSINRTGVSSIGIQPRRPTWYYTNFETGICKVSDSILVQVDSLPAPLAIVADVDKDIYCQGETLVLTSPIYEPVNYPAITHQWLFGLGYETPDSLFNMAVTLQDSFNYQRITTNNACVDTNAIFLPVLSPPELGIRTDNATTCEGEELILEAQYEGSGTIEWSGGLNFSCRDCPMPTIRPPVGSSLVTLSVEEQGCRFDVSTEVNVVPLPNISLSIQSNPGDTIYVGEQFELTALTGGITFDAYNWEIDGVETPTTTNSYGGITPTLEVGQDIGSLPVRLSVTTTEGCIISTELTLVIIQGRIQIPGAFTPNGDGINDIFRVYHNTPVISVSQFTVYSRWGKVVFESNSNQGWDGTLNGRALPSDVYLYHIVYRLGTFGEEQVIRGDVTLVR